MGFLQASRRMDRIGAAKREDQDILSMEDNVSLIDHTKAAAWAWHGRTGASKSSLVPHSSPSGESRFRLEAVVNDSGKRQIVLGNGKSSLLDAYELDSFSRRLEEALRGSRGSNADAAKLERSSSLSRIVGRKSSSKIMWLCGKFSAAFHFRSSKRVPLERNCETTKLL